ncbi:MAG: hypothetical protein KAI47_05170, partial [Deltaproteobacteria bacterium]|nr:hypothetical protein [Deltaproteobacteria bacterium]
MAQLVTRLNAPGDVRLIAVVGEGGAGKSRLIAEALRHQRLHYAAGQGEAFDVVEGDLRVLLDRGDEQDEGGDGQDEGGDGQDKGLDGAVVGDEVTGGPEGIDDLAVALADAIDRRARRRRQILVLGHVEDDPLVARLARLLLSGEGSEVVAIAECGREASACTELDVSGTPSGAFEWISLSPMGLEATRMLVGSMLGRDPSPTLVEKTWRRSVGNVSVLIEMVRAWAIGGDTELDRLTQENAALAPILARSRERLSGGEALRVVDALAVWGDATKIGVLSGLTDEGDPSWSTLLALAQQGLVKVEGGHVSMPSAAHYAAWRDAIPEPRRCALYRAVATKVSDPIRRAELLAAACSLSTEAG